MGLVKKLLVVVGPTAVGKTALSLRLAHAFQGEIISADSRLFYRGMDIGTAKPTLAEQSLIQHHLLDIRDPDQTLTLGQFQRLAIAAIDRISIAGHLPIMVGGTGQYIMAVIEGWGIPEVPPNPHLREKLGQLGEKELSRWLTALDPIAAANIDQRNIRRVVRALEVTLISGIPISELQRKSSPPFSICIIGLNRSRDLLYQRIDRRVENMLAEGFLEEVISLRKAGYDRSLPSMSGLGYRQIIAYLEGESSLEEAVEKTKFETHRFARQQKTWFRQDDPRIHWFDPGEIGAEDAVMELVSQWLAKGSAVK